MLEWVCFLYLHGATVTLLPSLHEAVPAHSRSIHGLVVWFVQQTAGVAIRQVPFVAVDAAAAEGPRDVPAAEKHRCHLSYSTCISSWFKRGDNVTHNAAVPPTVKIWQLLVCSLMQRLTNTPMCMRAKQNMNRQKVFYPMNHWCVFLPESCSHDAAIPWTNTGTGVIMVHAQVVAHLMSQCSSHCNGPVIVVLRDNRPPVMSTTLDLFYHI